MNLTLPLRQGPLPALTARRAVPRLVRDRPACHPTGTPGCFGARAHPGPAGPRGREGE